MSSHFLGRVLERDSARPPALHVRDNVIAKFGALDFRRAFHLAREIVSDPLAGDRAVQSFED